MDPAERTRALLAAAGELGIAACGVCAAEPYAETERLIRERRAAGLFADMGFTVRRPDRSCHPETLLRNARSVVVAARSYARPEPEKPADRPRGRMPRYTRRDEYAPLREDLKALGARLQALAPRSRFAVYVDSNHHVDREAAARAGIAVYGKNTLAITRRHGSWVVLGVLVTDAELAPTQADPDAPAWDACGSCRACIDACPTGAIVADAVLDARRCLSWLSQSRLPDLPHAEAFEDRVYGCDICQDVCPWNTGADRRAAGLEPDALDDAFPPLAEWLEADPDALAERYRRLYIPDRDGRHLQRNARVALANVSRDSPEHSNGLPEHEDGLRRLIADAHGTRYKAFSSLDEARGVTDAALVMQGDDGGSIYLTCPVRLVHCDEATLRRLLLDLDRRVWNDPDSTALLYEEAPLGTVIAGGTGGGGVIDGVWLHADLGEPHLRSAVEAVLAGERESIA